MRLTFSSTVFYSLLRTCALFGLLAGALHIRHGTAAAGGDTPGKVITRFAGLFTGTWKSLSTIMAPAPRIVPSPISMDLPAQMTVALMPTRAPMIIWAPREMARTTQG